MSDAAVGGNDSLEGGGGDDDLYGDGSRADSAVGGADVFVHISDVERSGMDNLREGQRVAFEVHEDPKSRKSSATNLRPA